MTLLNVAFAAVRRAALAAAVVLLVVAPAGAVKIDRVISPGGIEAWLVQDRLIPMLSLEFALRGGTTLDPVGKEGAAQLLADLMTEGAGDLDSQAFQGMLEDRVISMGFSAGIDSFSGSLKTLNEHRDVAVDLLRQALTRPRLDPAAVERVRSRVLSGLQRVAEDPSTIARRTWMQTAFPAHPYGRPGRGTVESVPGITVDDLRAARARHLARGNLIVGAVGDITPEALGLLLDRVFGELPAQPDRAVTVPETKAEGLGRTIVVRRAIPQSVVLFGHDGIKRDDPDFFAATLVNYILGGGGFNSRLTLEVREKRGLAYSVYSGLSTYERAGLIMGGIGTENARVAKSLDVIRTEWALMRDQGPTVEELEDAKTYLNGSFPLQLDATARIASMLVSIQYERLGIDYIDRRKELINAVTLERAKAVARRLFDPDRLLTVVVGEPEGIAAVDPGSAPAKGG